MTNYAFLNYFPTYSETSKPENKWWNWDGESLLKKPKMYEFVKPDDTSEPLEKEEDDAKKESDYKEETPRKQKVPGKSFGLSILLNPDLDEYFCTTSDSVGFRVRFSEYTYLSFLNVILN